MSHDVLLEGVWFVWMSPVPGPSGTHSDSEQDLYEFRDANGFRREVAGTRERILAGDTSELVEALAQYPSQEPVPDPAPVTPEPGAQPPAPLRQFEPLAPEPEPEPVAPEPPAGDASPTPEPTPQ